MKVLATIESVKQTRTVPRDDGTFGPVYGIKLVCGDDEILAERFASEEGLKKAGIVKGAVGTAHLEFKVNEGTGKNGKDYCFQGIKLRNFDLANRNISTESAQTAAEETGAPSPSWTKEHKAGGATEQHKEEKPAEGTQVPAEPQEPKPEEGKTSDLPF